MPDKADKSAKSGFVLHYPAKLIPICFQDDCNNIGLT